MNFKKIALVAIFIAVTIGLGFVMYRLFFYTAPTPVVTGPECGNAQCEEGETSASCLVDCPLGPGGLPTAGTGRPGEGVPTETVGLPTAGTVIPTKVAQGGPTETATVSEVPVLKPKMSPSGRLTYYNQADGKFYRVLPDGSVEPLSDKVFPEVSDVSWSPQGNKAVVEFPDASKVIYDFDLQRQTTIPKHWEDFSWSSDGDSITTKSIGLDPANRWLISVSADGGQAKLIEPLGENGDKVIVNVSPDNSVVAFSDTAEAIGFNARDYLLIGRNEENFKALRVEGFGFIPQWTPDGQNILYSSAAGANSYQPTLWFAGAKGDNIGAGRTDLGIRTWADKCTFSDASTAYCAVPDYLPDGAGLERGIAKGIPDSVVRIDLRNGSATPVGRPAQDASMRDVVVSPDGSKLFYTDDLTGALKEMLLK